MASLHEGQAKEVSRGFERSARARRMIAYWQVDKLEFRLLFSRRMAALIYRIAGAATVASEIPFLSLGRSSVICLVA
ncbi:MAG: hypothetical protein VXY82_12875 [Planctomycetota bacterium]|nr:hypothetical protein [Planctomycetota bacterium]